MYVTTFAFPMLALAVLASTSVFCVWLAFGRAAVTSSPGSISLLSRQSAEQRWCMVPAWLSGPGALCFVSAPEASHESLSH